MPAREGNYKKRSDAGKKRVSYNAKVDTTGKTYKENALLKSFWSHHKMEDVIKLTLEELDAKIQTWIADFEEGQRKRNRIWTWPTYLYDPTPPVKKEKKVNTKFNSSFINR